MSLTVVVSNATNLPNIEKFGKIDPLAIVKFQGSKKETKHINDELNPTWNETFTWDLGGKPLTSADSLEVEVKDHEKIGRNRLLGSATVPLRDLLQSKSHSLSNTLKLLDGNKRPTTGEISIQIKYAPPPGSEGATKGGGSGGGGGQTTGTAADGDADEGDADEDEGDDGDEGGEGDGGDEDGGGGGGGGAAAIAGMRKRKKRRGKLSKKPQDFQVRVKVWEARQLAGGNIHPVLKVTVSNQTKMTRVKKSTNRPYWDEVFFFNFHASPAELFDEVINFQVFNSRKLRSDAFIGNFELDIGTVYEADNHSIMNKWLLLSNAEDANAGAKGYVLVSMGVLAQGDEASVFKKCDDSDDIETNLLRPAGMQLRKGMFIVKVYNAEDIPQMDAGLFEGIKNILGSGSGKKELVDPYLIASFAGKKVKTDVKYTNDHPDWNQELRVPIRFPSMCEKLKLQMRDWDRVSNDDYIGTAFVDISSVSSPGEEEEEVAEEGRSTPALKGFLPTFGPCFVNFYGSTREFSELPDQYEDLNMGKGEGVAYRGRVLLSLETKLGEHPEVQAEELSHQDVLRVQKYLRRRKYILYACFIDATMVSESDDPVEFEVSIGNYGNKLDENCEPQASTTQPTNAVYDGCKYYFLPWVENKPLVVINSDWEDVSFRLNSLNLLLRKVERLSSNIEKVQMSLKAGAPPAEVAAQLIGTIDQLVADCREPLPAIDPTKDKANILDQRRFDTRTACLATIVEEATKLRENATDVSEAMEEIQGYLHILQELAVEPQNSMPDVIVWMISGSKRIAFHRIPSYDLLFSSLHPDACGKLCGKLNSIFLKFAGKSSMNIGAKKIPAMLRMKLWLGLEADSENFQKGLTDSSVAVFAETYENQMSILGNWTSKALPRPKFSDSTGKIKLKKESFSPPEGWRWEGDWHVSPELSLLYDADAGMTKFLEDVYEHESRNIPGGYWGSSSVPFTNVKGDACTAREEIQPPEGWEWEEVWQLDINRAVDEEGFEYCVEATVGGWGAVEKTYHLCRRRRWVRPRILVADPKALEKKKKKDLGEGWEFAPLFNMKFHATERKMDLVRRRRWHRKMVAESPKAKAVFSMGKDDESGDEESKASLSVPRMFLNFHMANKYQLRAYIYQARDLIAADSDSFSDPFAYVSFLNRSQKTELKKKTLCPTWDQTLIFDEIEIPGDPTIIAANPPDIVVEVFDDDTFGSDEFMGRVVMKPVVKLDSADQRVARLAWYTLCKGEGHAGELLASFELFLMSETSDLPFMPPMRGDLFLVPNGIRPVMQRTGVEFLCWGVRNMKKFQLSAVTSPCIEFEVGGKIISSKVIKNTKKNPNFDSPLLFLEVDLPKEELYTPPINLKVRDHRAFGRKPIVGVSVIKNLSEYRVTPTVEPTNGTPPSLEKPTGNGVSEVPSSELDASTTTDGAQEDTGLLQGKEVLFGDSDEMEPEVVATLMGELLSESVNRIAESAHSQSQSGDEVAPGTKGPGQTGSGTPGGGSTVSSTGAGEADHVVIMPEEEPPAETEPATDQPLKTVKKKFKRMVAFGIKHIKYIQLASSDMDMPFIPEVNEDEIDWWSKYYASVGEVEKCGDYLERGYDTLEIFPGPLENVEPYSGFSDFCNTYELSRGKSSDKDDEESSNVGEFKGLFRIYPLPGDPKAPLPPKVFKHLPPSSPVECVIRLYAIKAIDLQPQDPSGLSDPYLKVQLGKKKISEDDDYIPNTLNPVFGKMFEIKTFLPVYKDLTVSVWDHDLLSKDDIIGETVIDLENRFLTKYRASCGLPQSYSVSGPNKWRDTQKPMEILDDYCKKNNIPGPFYYGATKVSVDGKMYNLADFELNKIHTDHEGPADERLALYVLRAQGLVKEHLETRPLYSPLLPGIEQGKLQMWVDIFPLNLGPPGEPRDIMPRQPKKYVLRCVIWNTKDVILDETSITGEKMSDIYVKGWMAGQDEKQQTDVHYRSLNGEGNFNWRFVYPFEYIPPEQVMVIKKKEHFWSLDKTETHVPPSLILQVWDNDKFSADDFLGTLELNLNNMPAPRKKSRQSGLKQLPDNKEGKEVAMVSLFEQKRVNGWWPCISEETGERQLTGKLELELEIVTEQEAEERPAAPARDDPNANPTLDPPKRPETSFLWFTSPWKTLKFIIWHNYKWYIIGFLLAIILIAFVVLFIYSVPGVSVQKIFGAK
ncbi:dysferlin-like isoform X4 [Acanthaster planci]|uniref:Dysferlin-like isoform X4 n=1 Tax=Acanthaster planci TaxID=133434 RepID=A0A8B7YTI8_ACAPL|nr:dysferlin-like isoform X4 [Acanthaster planci]